MEHGDRRGDRGGGADPGDLHADKRFRGRIPRVRSAPDSGVHGRVTLALTATSVEAGMAHLAWPFFDDRHREFARELRAWAAAEIAPLVAHESTDVDADFRKLVQTLGRGGWLRYAVPAPYGVAPARLDVRTICLARETLGQLSGMADFAFAMQGLGT